MNKLITFILIPLLCCSVFGQQVPLYNHFLINPFVFNPSMAGVNGNINTSLARNQRLTSFGSVSVANYLTAEGNFEKENSGFGLTILSQSRGLQTQIGSTLTYSYRAKIGKDNEMRFGLSGGVLDSRIDVGGINAMHEDDPYLQSIRSSALAFDMNFGMAFRTRKMTIGLSIPQLAGNKVDFIKDKTRGYYRLARHYMLSFDYAIGFGKKKEIILKPYVNARFVQGAPIQYDVIAHVEYKKMLWASVGYRSNYALQFNAGVKFLKAFRVGFSYEYAIGKVKKYVASSFNHEIFIGYTFNTKTKQTIRLEDRKEDNAELRRSLKDELSRNQDLENEVRKAQIAKEKADAERQQMKDRLEELQRELDKPVKEDKPERVEVVKVPEKQTEPVVVKVKEENPEVVSDIPYSKGYHFTELDGTDSPNGLYVIIGVFSDYQNADKVRIKNKDEYPGAYVLRNKNNGNFYTVILYSTDYPKSRALADAYKQRTGLKVWVLNYRLL